MWIYSQSTGSLWSDNGERVATGYSGKGEGKNNPALEHVKNVGPIPRGLYTIGQPYNSDNVGPYALPLTPVLHDAHERTDLLAHGDSISDPGNASEGCVILPRPIRQRIFNSGDLILKVVE